MAEKKKSFEWSDGLYVACIMGLVSIAVSLCQDFLDILTFIPGWIIDALKALGWCLIFKFVDWYCRDRFDFRSKMFTVLIVLQIIMFVDGLFSVSPEYLGAASISLSSQVPVLGTVMTLLELAFYGIMLAIGMKILKFNMSKKVPCAFIIFAAFGIIGGLVNLFASDQTSIAFTIIYSIPLLIVEMVALFLIKNYFEHTSLNQLKHHTVGEVSEDSEQDKNSSAESLTK